MNKSLINYKLNYKTANKFLKSKLPVKKNQQIANNNK